MPDPFQIIQASTAAGVVAAIVMLAAAWASRKGRVGLATLADVLAFGAGMAVGCWWLGLAPKLPPIEDRDRLFVVLLPAAAIVEIIAGLSRRRPWVGYVLRVLLALPIPALLLFGSGWLPAAWAGMDPSAPSTWTPQEAIAMLVGLGVLLAAMWGLLVWAAQRPGGFVVPAALGLLVAAAGTCVALSGSVNEGQIGLPFAGVAAGALLVCTLFARGHAMTGLVGLGAVLLFGVLMGGRFFSDLTTTNFALLAAAPFLCALIALPPVRQFKAPLRFITALLVCLIPAAVAGGLAYRTFAAETAESSAYTGATSGGDAPAFGMAAPSTAPASGASKALEPEPTAPSGTPRDPGADEQDAGARSKPSRPPVDPGEEMKK
ncbi:MAG TPA: hypothetical protein VGP63_01200 [Planctomycetaceae bacterium]|jgi:hypothetical protein|nr:hypothetical protein [Planctomycetaceae bacterium]